jgi:hypothetical protein
VSVWIVGIRARVFEKIGIKSLCMYVCGDRYWKRSEIV